MSSSGKSGFGPQMTGTQRQAIDSQSPWNPSTVSPDSSAAVVDPNAANPLGPQGQQPVTPQAPGGSPDMFGGGKGGFGNPTPVQQPQQPDIYSRMGGQQNVDSNPNLDGYQPPTNTPMQPTMPQGPQMGFGMPSGGMGGGKSMFNGSGQSITPEQLQNFASQLFKQ
jgi:hypothetical protein